MEKQQRLIDADALVKTFESMGLGEHGLIERVFADGVYAVIENAPTIDAVPVVRCKECRFRGNPMNCPMCHEEDYYDEDYGFDDIVRDKTIDEGYCQKGEREDENE